ncbi:MAG: hypothetical protein U0559_02285 [Anaerolineae bacterium]
MIIDSVVSSIGAKVDAQTGLTATLPYLAIEFVLILASAGVGQARSLTEHILHTPQLHAQHASDPQAHNGSISRTLRTPSSTTSCKTLVAKPIGARCRS